MQFRRNRTMEREAVNAVRSFFEAHECVFQEIDSSNDYGKDAYVDFGHAGQVTGLSAGVQIKGGQSYRTPDGNYRIPVDDAHRRVWAESTLPIIGLVYDPSDKQIRWGSISAELIADPAATAIRIHREQILDVQSLLGSFRAALTRPDSGTHPLVAALSDDEDESIAGVWDCLALARVDERTLIGLRYLLRAMKTEATFLAALHVLAYTTPHPDIAWPSNWLSDAKCKNVVRHFRWSVEDVLLFLRIVPLEFVRGTPAQDLTMLLAKDATQHETLWRAAEILLDSDLVTAFVALCMSVHWKDRPLDAYELFASRHPVIRTHNVFDEVHAYLAEHGELPLIT